MEPRITILLPESLLFEHVTLHLGAGKMNMEQFPLSCHDMNVSIGAGKWKTKQLSVSQNLHIEVGAGKVNLQQAKSGSLKLDCGAGNCFYHGEIYNVFKISCGVVYCELQLANKEQDFDYDISCALGEIQINGNRMRNLSLKRHSSQENELNKAILQCGVGRIILETA